MQFSKKIHLQLVFCKTVVKMRFITVLMTIVVLFLGSCVGQDNEGSGRKALVPAMFVFGDSLIDNGNNNNLPSFAKANYFPYGIDFNGGPTGRFSNSYTIVDEVAELIGLPLTPAFSEARGQQMLYGVNYASAAAGILDVTGRNFVGRIPFNQQMANFEVTLNEITATLGRVDDVRRAIGECLFFVGMGSNDYLNNYLMPNYPTKNQYNGPQFANLLVQQYTNQLTRLYNLGGRKFAIAGLGMMGCMPNILAQSPTGNCSESVNQLVQPFNANVKTMVNNLNARLPGSQFIYLDINNMFRDILFRPSSYGIKVTDQGCCGVGRNQGQITCLPLETPCNNRDEYVFWDAFHPTGKVNVILGQRAFNGGLDVAYPMNIQQLASLNLN